MLKPKFIKGLILAFLILSLLSSSFVFQLLLFKAHRGLALMRTINETAINKVGGEKRSMKIEITSSTSFYLFFAYIDLSFMISDNAHPEAYISGFFSPYAPTEPDDYCPYCCVRDFGKDYNLYIFLGNADTGCKEKEIIEPYAKDFISRFRRMPNSISPIEQFHLFGGYLWGEILSFLSFRGLPMPGEVPFIGILLMIILGGLPITIIRFVTLIYLPLIVLIPSFLSVPFFIVWLLSLIFLTVDYFYSFKITTKFLRRVKGYFTRK